MCDGAALVGLLIFAGIAVFSVLAAVIVMLRKNEE